jgi:hypothetical protein
VNRSCRIGQGNNGQRNEYGQGWPLPVGRAVAAEQPKVIDFARLISHARNHDSRQAMRYRPGSGNLLNLKAEI